MKETMQTKSADPWMTGIRARTNLSVSPQQFVTGLDSCSTPRRFSRAEGWDQPPG
jgi:hypothetical protein